MKIKCFFHHRFQHLIPSIPKNWEIYNSPIVDKTMTWEFPDKQIWWEYHDGILPKAGIESTERLDLCFAARNKNKRFFYIKPNISNFQSIDFFKLAEKNNFHILSCPKWSYYHDVYDYIKHNRFSFRESIKNNSLRTTKIVFCGSLKGYNGKNNWGDNVSIHSGLNKFQYVETLIKSAYALQPHGGGLRHSTYECMAIGIPCIIPESSYIDNITRLSNIVYDIMPTNIPEYKSQEWEELSNNCIEIWESKMTANAIISNVLSQIEIIESQI
jgi:hypothetical protein